MLMGDSFSPLFSGSRGTVSIQTGFWTMNMYLESFLLFPRCLWNFHRCYCWKYIGPDIIAILLHVIGKWYFYVGEFFVCNADFRKWDFWHFVVDKIVDTLKILKILVVCSCNLLNLDLMVFFNFERLIL